MEESKTLVEQLRDTVEESRKGGAFPTWYAASFITNRPYNSDVEYERELFTAIADRIEREYIPRPRFEDGEPVQFGDEFYSDEHSKTYKATMFVIYADGSYRVNQAGCNACQYDPGERVKRPEPEVLDADGVPIRKGDTVWYEGERYRVTDAYMLDGEDPGVDLESFSTVMGEPTKTIMNAWNKLVTHKQPDTLERIEEDALMKAGDYCMEYDIDCLIGECEKAMRLDLLRRQREVLESGQE